MHNVDFFFQRGNQIWLASSDQDEEEKCEEFSGRFREYEEEKDDEKEGNQRKLISCTFLFLLTISFIFHLVIFVGFKDNRPKLCSFLLTVFHF